MNYKKIIKSRAIRHKILKLLSFIPDKMMVKLQYRIKFGRWPNLKNPKRYTEKIQLYKLYYRNPDMTVCSDKHAVREYVARKGLKNILIRQLGVYDNAADIDFGSLPDKFVLKTNDGGGGNNVIICKDKSKLDIPKTVEELNSWLNIKNINPGREWGYSGIPKSVVLVEEFIENSDNPSVSIDDYKFYCFHGRIFCIQHDVGRYSDAHYRTFYDSDWNQMHARMLLDENPEIELKPENLEEMKTIALKLAEDFPHVRVDLYSVGGRVYFGELTFYTGAGYNRVSPDDFDFQMGDAFDVSTFMPKQTDK